MKSILERINQLNDLVLQGKAMEAFERFYHEDVVMQENEDALSWAKRPTVSGRIVFFLDNRVQKCPTN